MIPSPRMREVVIKTASMWHGLRAVVDPETRLRARLQTQLEWKLRRRERKAQIRAAVRAYRAANGDERTQSLKAGARVVRQDMAQKRVDKEFELRERMANQALQTTPKKPIEELEVEK